MARKRVRVPAEDSSIDESGDNLSEGDDNVSDENIQDVGFDSDDAVQLDSDAGESSDSEDMNYALYQQCLKELRGLEKLKVKLSKSVLQKAKKRKAVHKPKDAFTRFSVTYFSSLIESLSPHRRAVIESYGFGSLLKFEKCFVPNKFAQWVARHVDHKSGDIVMKSSIIPMNSESVSYVLDLPLGGSPFPKDPSVGKSKLLSRFQLATIPKVKFFGDKLLSQTEMSDEDVFTCFILVALNCFLCPNSSVFPATKYLGIFEDLSIVKKFDWCQFLIDWLLDAIKSFNKSKSKAGKEKSTLGGCLYFIAVYYLDFVNFGYRQVPPGFPRIMFWKEMMIKTYAELDQITPGVYGFRPLLDISATCYSKQSVFMHKKPPSLTQNSAFIEQLVITSGCKLPRALTTGICKLIEEHSLNCALTLNMDVTSLSSLSDELKKSFSTLLEHAYAVDTRTQNLVLKLLKLLREAIDMDEDEDEDLSQKVQSADKVVNGENVGPEQFPLSSARSTENGFDCQQHHSNTHVQEDKPHLNVSSNVDCSPHVSEGPITRICTPKKIPSSGPSSQGHSRKQDSVQKHAHVTPSHSNLKLNSDDVNTVMQKLSKNGSSLKSALNQEHYPAVHPATSQHRTQSPHYKKTRSRLDLIENYHTESEIAKLRDPLYDLDDNTTDYQVLKKNVEYVRENGERDVIYLDNDNDYVHDFVSPPSNGFGSRYVFRKRSPEEDDEEMDSTQQTPMFMQTLESSQPTPQKVTPKLSQHRITPCLKSVTFKEDKTSPEVQILGERDVFAASSEMSKKAEQIYNKNMNFGYGSSKNSAATVSTPVVDKHSAFVNLDNNDTGSGINKSSSTTGGKLAPYGPRRFVQPVVRDQLHQFDTKSRFPVGSSELKNYKAIRNLASSKWKDHFAIDIGGVKCTFTSLWEAMRSGGVVYSFVINVFCRTLFMKANGHPDVSKKHFFFSTIGDNFLKHPDDANLELLQRSYKRAGKARPLALSNLIFYPIQFENHWFLFIVDIKDHYFVFLDSIHTKDDPYQQHVRERLIPSFMFFWDKLVPHDRDMKFDDYKVVYPAVPQQGNDNINDDGIFVLMFLQHWQSPRTVLSSIFSVNDIANIRVKIGNELMFHPNNVGLKRLVLHYDDKELEE